MLCIRLTGHLTIRVYCIAFRCILPSNTNSDMLHEDSNIDSQSSAMMVKPLEQVKLTNETHAPAYKAIFLISVRIFLSFPVMHFDELLLLCVTFVFYFRYCMPFAASNGAFDASFRIAEHKISQKCTTFTVFL